jgi:uncharacterized protein with PIN domain
VVEKIEKEGWTIYSSDIQECINCGGNIVRQRKVSAIKEIGDRKMRVKGKKCNKCGKTYNVSDSV